MRHPPQLSVKTWGGGSWGGVQLGVGGVLPGVGGGGVPAGGRGGVWPGVRGGVQPGLGGGGIRVRVTELVEPVLVL